jgi:alkanesulfonate monooxygenase SsuD/methylene tetrahydromethanopterin reductase-like flavin-dependent oxidoreductase (luciferase family)
MQFGLIFELSVPRPFAPGVEQAVFHNAIEQARFAESLGFSHAWCVEHHFLEEYSHSSCPEMFLAACAMVTSRLRLGFGIATCVPEMSHPARLAERCAFLDVLSNGRAEFGTGRSSTWTELGGFGARPETTKRTWDEFVHAIPRMWTQERFSYKGHSFSMPERAILPKPVQKPHPPMWLAVTAPGTELDAAQRGLGCLTLSYGNVSKNAKRFDAYRKLIRGCTPVGAFANEKVAAANWLYCHEDRKIAGRRGEALVQAFSSMAAQTLEISQAFPASNYSALGLLGRLRADPDMSADKALPDGLCIGDPSEIVATIKDWESAGLDLLLFMVNAREVLAQSEVLASLDLFGREVMPHFAPGAETTSAFRERIAHVA